MSTYPPEVCSALTVEQLATDTSDLCKKVISEIEGIIAFLERQNREAREILERYYPTPTELADKAERGQGEEDPDALRP